LLVNTISPQIFTACCRPATALKSKALPHLYQGEVIGAANYRGKWQGARCTDHFTSIEYSLRSTT
jgi:hypothetical protein